MAVTNTFAITYNGVTVGGSSSSYQLLGPYVVEKTFERLRLAFDVLVVADSQTTLRTLSEDIEEAMSARDKEFRITIAGSSWTYEPGTDVLNVVASIVKSGDPATDKSHSRAYSVTIEAGLPETAREGLREISSVVNVDTSGRSMVTFSGVYTAQEGETATEVYTSSADAKCEELLSLYRSEDATFELVDETFTPDANNHLCQFQRQYREVIYNQGNGTLDDPRVKDHRVTFTDRWSQPGDALPNTVRLRRVDASIDCAVVIGESTPGELWESSIRQYLLDEFLSEFSPGQYAIEESSHTLDRTGSRLMGTMRIVFTGQSNSVVVSVAQSLTYREARTLDVTPTHSGRETDMYVDPGWATIERVWIRSVDVVGDETPRRRLHQEGGVAARRRSGGASAGDFLGPIGGVAGPDTGGVYRAVQRDGWNVVNSQSQVTEQWMGHPEYGSQFKVTTLNETVIERYNTSPSSATTGGR